MKSAAERRLRILQLLVGDRDSDLSSARLCVGAARAIGVDGAGVMLKAGEVAAGTGCSSDETAAAIESLQFVLGEGPCIDAYDQSRPVTEPDLAAAETPRWPAFAPAAVEVGARAVFGFPLLVGAVRVGALDLYRREPGLLSDEEHADALVAADVVARTLLLMQSIAPSGSVAAEIQAGGDLQYVVHQAAGMVAAQLNIGVEQALVRLRAFAFAADRPIAEVAGDIVGRRLRMNGSDLR